MEHSNHNPVFWKKVLIGVLIAVGIIVVIREIFAWMLIGEVKDLVTKQSKIVEMQQKKSAEDASATQKKFDEQWNENEKLFNDMRSSMEKSQQNMAEGFDHAQQNFNKSFTEMPKKMAEEQKDYMQMMEDNHQKESNDIDARMKKALQASDERSSSPKAQEKQVEQGNFQFNAQNKEGKE